MQQIHQTATTYYSQQGAPDFTHQREERTTLMNHNDTDEEPGADQTSVRQGIMHVRIEHFYCTMEEMLDPSLHGQSFIVGTGTGRPNEPGRVIDVSPAAAKQGLAAGMPLRRAHRVAPRTRFLPASYDHYQPVLQKLKEYYRSYSRIIESIPISDAFIDLGACSIPFDTPVRLAEQLCATIEEMGFTPLIGVGSGKTIAELAAVMSRKDGRQGVLYIPEGREVSFIQSLPLSLLLKLRAAGAGQPGAQSDPPERNEHGTNESENKGDQVDAVAITELVSHLRDFGITTFAQVANLTEEGLGRRLGSIGSWLYQVSHGMDYSLVVPDAPPLSQNARVRFQHQADADETCGAIRKLADYLGNRLQEQRLRGQSIALILWPNRIKRETRKLMQDENGEETAVTTAEETISGQMTLSRPTDEADIIAHHSLMLFAHYHTSGMRYLQVQLRIGDIVITMPSYNMPQGRPNGRLTRKL